MAQAWPRTARSDRPKRKSDVRKSSDTLEPMSGLAGGSTAKRIAAWRGESSDEETPVVQRRRPTAPARRSVSSDLFGAKRRKTAPTPVTVRERTAARLLESVCGGKLRPPRPPPVKRNGKYHCPFCFLAKADDSAGALCRPIPKEARAGKPKTGRWGDPLKYFQEWDDNAYQRHLAEHGFPLKKRGQKERPFVKEGAGTGGNPTNPGVARGTPRHNYRPVWKFKVGSGFGIEMVRVRRGRE